MAIADTETGQGRTEPHGEAPPRVVFRQFIVPILVALVANLAITLGLFLIATDRADEYARLNGRKVLALALEDAKSEVALLSYEHAHREETARHVMAAPDAAWMARNLGAHLTRVHRIRLSVVVAPDGTIQTAFRDGVPLAEGLEAVRAAVAPLAKRLGMAGREPAPAGALVLLGAGYFVAGGSLVASPEYADDRMAAAGGRHALILLRPLDEAMIARLGDRLGLIGLRLVPADGAGLAGRGAAVSLAVGAADLSHAVAVEDAAGGHLGWLAWTPESPGWTLLSRALVPLLILAVLIAWVIAWILRRAIVLDHYQHVTTRARASAEQANRAKSQFLAMISHEVRTPLTAIMGTVDLLLASPLTEEQHEFVETMRASAKAQLALLNDLLDFSKIEAGRLTLEEVDFDLAAVVDEVVRLFETPAREKGLSFTVPVPPDMGGGLRGDPKRLKQVLSNLLSNAIKFTERGGVSLRLAECRRDDDGTLLRFEVADTGIGIDPGQLIRLFEPFVQGDQSTARQFGGTGLGLAICKRLAEVMGGSIGVTSEPGQGSTFWFTARLGTAPPFCQGGRGIGPCAAVPVRGIRSGRGYRILLAEDSRANCLLITAMLKRLGHTVVAVENGGRAVEAAMRGGFDVILMDLHMPEMDGASAAGRIRELPGPAGAVPIVALTADAMPDVPGLLAEGRVDEAMFDGYVTKPIDWEQLARVLAGLAGHSPIRAGGAPVLAEDGCLQTPAGRERQALMLELVTGAVRREVAALKAAHGAGDGKGLRQAAEAVARLAGDFGLKRLEKAATALREGGGDPASLIRQLDEALERTLDTTVER